MFHLNYRAIGLSAVMLSCFTSPMVVASGLNPTLNDNFTFRLGGVSLDGDTTVSSTIKTSEDLPIGTDIDLGDLGIGGSQTSMWLGGHWRFAKKWRLDYEYFGSKQDGTGIAEADIRFGDIVIPAGIAAKAEFETDIYLLGVGWSFLRDEKSELGIGLGLHVADLNIGIEGVGFIEDTLIPIGKETATATAPLPNARLYGAYAFTPTLALEGGVGWLSLNYGDFDGSLTTLSAVLEWRPSKNFGVGIGYTLFNVDLTVEDDVSRDEYDFRLNGPVLFVSTGF
jgi:hypothetical protein